MKSSKHLASLVIASIAMVALFTGCNKNEWSGNNPGSPLSGHSSDSQPT